MDANKRFNLVKINNLKDESNDFIINIENFFERRS
jgi:hypothetical protein